MATRDTQQRTIHTAWHLAGASFAILVGIALSTQLTASPATFIILLVAGLTSLVIGLARRTRSALIFSIAAGLSIGLWRGGIEQTALQNYQPYYGQSVQVQGRVTEDVGHGKQGDMRLTISDVTINGKPLTGRIWISSNTKADIDRSDVVVFSGVLSEGFGNLPASVKKANLVKRDRPQPGDVALHVRDRFAEGIRNAIPDPEASLGAGFLTGQRSSLPADLDEELKVAGLTHIVVASGYNLTILVGFSRRLLAKFSRYTATMTAVGMVCCFVLVTGFSPSMSRAGLVTLMGLAAWYYGRTVHPLVILPLAATITALINPAYVWGDLGWYLSFGAFAGVLLLAPLISRYFWGDAEPSLLRGILVETSSAQLATMPIILYAFGTYSVYALLANMIILPLIPLTMALTFLAGIGGLAVPAIASWIGLPATAILTYMTAAVHKVANLPNATGELTFSTLALCISYAAIVLGIVYMWRRTGHRFNSDRVIGEKA